MARNRQKRFPRASTGQPPRQAVVLDEYGRILTFSTDGQEGRIETAGLLRRLRFALRPRPLPVVRPGGR